VVDILIRLSYPKQPGDTPWSMADVTGPASYVQVVPGTPSPLMVPSGGQPLVPHDFGLQSFHIILHQGSNDGLYSVVAIPVTTIPPGDDAFFAAVLMWIDLETGLEVDAATDLSASSVRLLAIGN
jgi:hypothetical protein